MRYLFELKLFFCEIVQDLKNSLKSFLSQHKSSGKYSRREIFVVQEFAEAVRETSAAAKAIKLREIYYSEISFSLQSNLYPVRRSLQFYCFFFFVKNVFLLF